MTDPDFDEVSDIAKIEPDTLSAGPPLSDPRKSEVCALRRLRFRDSMRTHTQKIEPARTIKPKAIPTIEDDGIGPLDGVVTIVSEVDVWAGEVVELGGWTVVEEVGGAGGVRRRRLNRP